jgi:hypothetical protein
MSKKNNVNPDHYKTAGRLRQGEAILQERQKQEYAQAQAQAEQAQPPANFIPGAAPLPTTPAETPVNDEQVTEERSETQQKPARPAQKEDEGKEDEKRAAAQRKG